LYGAVVTGAPTLEPSTWNWTWVIVYPSEGVALAESVTLTPPTVDPAVGAVTVTTGFARTQATVEDGVITTLEGLKPPAKVT
jgi:hypothetical protein